MKKLVLSLLVALIAISAAMAQSTVYFTKDISADSLVAIYNALGWQPRGKLAIKVSTGEPPASNYLRADLIGRLVKQTGGSIVECNTTYGGKRAQTAMHYQVAKDHGFTALAAFKVLDEAGDLSLPVSSPIRISENYVGKAFTDYQSYLILSHFKGHGMAGFGGALKNTSIGLASSMGKRWIHSGGTSKSYAWGGKQDAFCEAMADAARSVSDAVGKENIVYINVMNRLSIDCDCSGNPTKPDIHDIGIAASRDPVALDQACLDMVLAAEGSASFRRRVEGKNGVHTLISAEKGGLGSRKYAIVSLD